MGLCRVGIAALALLLGCSGDGEGADPVVVLTPRPGSGVRTGSVVEVTGALRRLTIAAVEAEFGIDLDDQGARDLEGGPALVATGLRTSG